MCSQEVIDNIDAGKLIPVKRWKYYISFWTPMIAILTFVSIGSIWFTRLESTTFDTPAQKAILTQLGERALVRENNLNLWLEETKRHIENKDEHMPLQERLSIFATKTELAELKEDLKDVKIDIRWIRNYLTNKGGE